MAFFEVEGVRRQEEAYSIANAKKQFEHSCELCALHGIPIRCENCKIQQAHLEKVRSLRIVSEIRSPEKYRKAYSARFGVFTQVYIRL